VARLMVVTLRTGDRAVEARVSGDGRVTIEAQDFTVTPMGPGMYAVVSGERRWEVAVAGPPDERWVAVDGEVAVIEITSGSGRRRRHSAHGDAMVAPMPATVVAIAVEPGQSVTRGDTVILLEAMKMELPVRAPRDGVVRAVLCASGELVQPGVPLVELEQAG
jgi:3-methylcrotonyl-CoA carboxylase alpha subunit